MASESIQIQDNELIKTGDVTRGFREHIGTTQAVEPMS